MIHTLTNPSGRAVYADDAALIQIVLRGEWPKFTLHTPVDPALFLVEAERQALASNIERLKAAAASCTAVPLPVADAPIAPTPEPAEPEPTPEPTPEPEPSKPAKGR